MCLYIHICDNFMNHYNPKTSACLWALALTMFLRFQGNVALDIARILLRPTTELAKTDIASQALTALEESSIRFYYPTFDCADKFLTLVESSMYMYKCYQFNCRKVYLVGRRGPVQAACTAKELREILGNS